MLHLLHQTLHALLYKCSCYLSLWTLITPLLFTSFYQYKSNTRYLLNLGLAERWLSRLSERLNRESSSSTALLRSTPKPSKTFCSTELLPNSFFSPVARTERCINWAGLNWITCVFCCHYIVVQYGVFCTEKKSIVIKWKHWMLRSSPGRGITAEESDKSTWRNRLTIGDDFNSG